MLRRLDPQDMLRWRRLLFSEACGEKIVASLIHETLSTLLSGAFLLSGRRTPWN